MKMDFQDLWNSGMKKGERWTTLPTTAALPTPAIPTKLARSVILATLTTLVTPALKISLKHLVNS